MEDRRLLWTSLLNSQHISLVIILGTWSLKAENEKYFEVHVSEQGQVQTVVLCMSTCLENEF